MAGRFPRGVSLWGNDLTNNFYFIFGFGCRHALSDFVVCEKVEEPVSLATRGASVFFVAISR